MTGYEFTRIDNDFTSKVPRAQYYDARTLVFKIEYNAHGLEPLRTSEDYKDAKEWFVDTTMSCTLEEAKNWMEYYMANAIAYGVVTKNLDWRTKFLAAYDLYDELCA